MAFDLGLDVNGNGDLDDEAISFQEVAGVGGSVEIPVLRIDSLALRAADGVDLLFRDIIVGIVDIDPAIPGVLGMNVLNSGWEAYSFNLFTSTVPLGPPGVIDRIDLDFRTAGAGQGEMRLSVSGPRDTFISQGAVVLTVPSGVQTQAQAGHAAIGGVGTVTKTGAGTAVLNAVNTVTGTTFVQGARCGSTSPTPSSAARRWCGRGPTLAVTDGVTARLPAVTLAGGTLAARRSS